VYSYATEDKLDWMRSNKVTPSKKKNNNSNNKDDDDNNIGITTVGVSIQCLKCIVDAIDRDHKATASVEVNDTNSTSSSSTTTTYDVVEKYIKNWTNGSNLSFTEYIQKKYSMEEHIPSHVTYDSRFFGTATVYVSHVWSYDFNTFYKALELFDSSNSVSSLEEEDVINTINMSIQLKEQQQEHYHDVKSSHSHHGMTTKRTLYFWIDILSINQHVLFSDSDYDLFKISKLINFIGNTCAVTMTWKNPINFKRLWCLTEMFMTYHTGAKLYLQYNDASHPELIDLLSIDYEQGIKSMNISIDVEHAETTHPYDKNALLDALLKIESSNYQVCDVSFHHINAMISKSIHTWVYLSSLRSMIDSLRSNMKISNHEIRESELIGKHASEFTWCEICCLAFGLKKKLKVEDILKSNLSEIHRERFVRSANVKLKVAAVLNELCKYTEAEEVLKDVLLENQMLFGEYHPTSLSIMGNLALLYKIQERYDDSEELYSIVLQHKEDTLGGAHPSTLTTLQNLGNLLRDAHKYDKAIMMFRRLIEDEEMELGYNHPDTVKSIDCLADIYLQCGHESDAVVLLKKTLAIKQEIYGKISVPVVMTYETLATLCVHELFDTEQAIEYFRLALECRETLFGRNHTSTVSTSLRFARLLKSLQDFDQSLLFFERVLQATEIRFGVLHHNCFDLIQQIIELHIQAMHYDQAELLYLDLYEKQKELDSELALSTIMVLYQIAELYVLTKRYQTAEEYHRKALQQRRKVLTPTDVLIGISHCGVAHCLACCDRMDDAKVHYEQALDIFDVSSPDGPTSELSLKTADSLSKICRATGDLQLCEVLLLRLKLHYRKILGPNHNKTLEYSKQLAEIVDEG